MDTKFLLLDDTTAARRDRGIAILQAASEEWEEVPGPDTAVVDVIADLLHVLVNAEQVDRVLSLARMHWEAEVGNEEVDG